MEQKLKNFINKWLNKYLEVVDATNKNQCFDLVVGWTDELGLPRTFKHLYAYQIYTVDTDEKKKYFDKIANTSDAFPLAGDIVVWAKTYNGTAGHTAVATGVHQTQGKSTDWFEAFTQNDPTGSPCILKKYSYTNVLGWLRPKKEFIKIDNYYKGIDLNNLESVKVCVDTWYEVAVEQKYVKKEEHQRIIAEKENTITNLNNQINGLNANLNKLNEEKNRLAEDNKVCQSNTASLKEQLDKLNQELLATRDKVVELEKLKDNWQIKESDYLKRIKYLETKLQSYKKSIKTLIVEMYNKIMGG